jgi:hypothetical protein
MANCPNCGSTHVQLIRDTNVNWGRAVAGWALFGVVGGAVGAVTGEDRNVISCLDCGTSWKASDLHKTIQLVKELTGIILDLTIDEDRLFINRFISEVTPYINAVSDAQKQVEKNTKESEARRSEAAAQGCAYGCLISLVGCTTAASAAAAGGLFLVFLIPPILGVCLGTLIDKANKKSIEQEIENIRKKSARLKIEAEENLRLKVDELANSFYI